MTKMAAEVIAEKELVTKDLIAKGKAALVADKVAVSRAAELSTDKVLEEKKAGMMEGESLEYEAGRVARFAATELKDLAAAGDRKSYKEPVAVVLPGVKKEGWGDEGQGLSLWNAFSSESQHLNMCKFVCKFVEDSGAHAAMFVSPSDKVLYPNLFKANKDKEVCPAGFGYLVQLQAKERADCAAWFVEVAKAGEAGTVTKLEDVDAWKLIPNVFDAGSMNAELNGQSKKQIKAAGKKNAAKQARKAMAQVNNTTTA